MRIQIAVVAIAVILVASENPQVFAQLQSSTQDRKNGIGTSESTIHNSPVRHSPNQPFLCRTWEREIVQYSYIKNNRRVVYAIHTKTAV